MFVFQANICNDPLEIYNFLYSQGIGTKTTALYEAWAWQVEQVGNIKKADLVYNKGIENGAQPIERLRQSQRWPFENDIIIMGNAEWVV